MLKIDRSFVADLPGDKNGAAIVETIEGGVETVAQLEFLRGQNCLTYQGFYFSWPVTAGEFLAFFTLKEYQGVRGGTPARGF